MVTVARLLTNRPPPAPNPPPPPPPPPAAALPPAPPMGAGILECQIADVDRSRIGKEYAIRVAAINGDDPGPRPGDRDAASAGKKGRQLACQVDDPCDIGRKCDRRRARPAHNGGVRLFNRQTERAGRRNNGVVRVGHDELSGGGIRAHPPEATNGRKGPDRTAPGAWQTEHVQSLDVRVSLFGRSNRTIGRLGSFDSVGVFDWGKRNAMRERIKSGGRPGRQQRLRCSTGARP